MNSQDTDEIKQLIRAVSEVHDKFKIKTTKTLDDLVSWQNLKDYIVKVQNILNNNRDRGHY